MGTEIKYLSNGWVPEDFLDNKTTEELDNASLRTRKLTRVIVRLEIKWDIKDCLSNSNILGNSIFN